jgi:hypothetical protein
MQTSHQAVERAWSVFTVVAVLAVGTLAKLDASIQLFHLSH